MFPSDFTLSKVDELMASADPSHEQELARLREYLCLLARLQVRPLVQAKLDVSGVVQQTLLEAHQAWSQLEGRAEVEKVAWLRRALANNLADALRKLRTAKRDIGREKSLEQALEQSSGRVADWLAAEQSTPSEQAMHHEQSLQLAEALATLPENQRRAIEMKHLNGLSLVETAQQLECSTASVVGLLHRGVQRLRELMQGRKEE
jgi:RNA polymerase sigma-70 factor (ECF subfamily)